VNKYLIFRTDRIGDFLLTTILINSIKRNDLNSHITVVSSKKNYDYIQTFKSVDEVILLENNYIKKIKLIIKLRFSYYKFIIIHDSKNRSSIISFFLKYGIKIKPNIDLNISYIDAIKEILSMLNFNFHESDLNSLKNRHYDSLEYSNNDFILLHFDEKWIYNDYIREYTNIEPTKDDLISFIKSILISSNKKLIITTGVNCPRILNDIANDNYNTRVKIFKKLDFFDLENLISKCKTLISCHGSVSHIAAAYNISQIDIIEKEKKDFYHKWTAHFRNYFPVYRVKFNELSKIIVNEIKFKE
jgi:ADP-heptose:LPS heptosyltransferase